MSFKKLPAFSIIEKAITILITGILLGISIFSYTKILKLSKQRISIDRVNTVKEALDEYYIKNNRLPCPAGFNDGDDSNEDCTKAMHIDTQSGNANVSILYGKVPSKTLNLTSDMENDGYLNMISYYVLQSFTSKNLRYYKNKNNPIEFITNENLQDVKFQDIIVADEYDLSLNAIGDETTDDISYFIKILSQKSKSFPENSRTNLINLYANSTTSNEDNGKVISLNAIFVVISHGNGGYCARNPNNQYQINQIPEAILNDPQFYYNDYLNCVNYIEPSQDSDNSRAFVFNSGTNSMSQYNNDIIAFSNFKSFYDNLLNDNKVDCVGFSANNTIKEYIGEIPYERSVSYLFNRNKSSNAIIQANQIISIPERTDDNLCSFMTENKYPMSNPSAICKNGDWTNFVPLSCGNSKSIQISIY